MMKDYPTGWMDEAKIKDVCTLRSGNGFPLEFQGSLIGEFGFYKVGDVSRNWQEGKISLSGAKHYLSSEEAEHIRAQPFPSGTVVFAKIGAAVALNRRAILSTESLIDNNVLGLIPHAATTSRYLFYFMCQVDLGARTRGGNVPSLRNGDVEEIEYPLPPLPEQYRIVAKIEELFSELDKGIENLKQARAQLAVYRQALLKHAFEGKLTADWRAARANQLESAEQLLNRIRAKREERYEQQLKQWKELHADWEKLDGRTTKPTKPRKPEPQSSILSEMSNKLSQLPQGWTYLRLGEVIDEPAYGTSKKCDYETEGTGVLRIPNVVAGSIDAADLKFASFTPQEIQSYALDVGDLLMIRSNGSVSIVGRCALIRDVHTHLLYAGYLIRLRAHTSSIDPAFLHRQLLSHGLRHQVEQAAKSTSGVNNINSGEIQSLVIAVCSVAEQQEIVTQLEEKMSAIDALEADLDLNLQKAEALRQSILKKAFAGELVPQDPNDEPAAVLLARIRAEREANTKPKPARRPKAPKPQQKKPEALQPVAGG